MKVPLSVISGKSGVIDLLKDVKYEKCTRKTFAKIGDSIEMPNLIKVQKDSYKKSVFGNIFLGTFDKVLLSF